MNFFCSSAEFDEYVTEMELDPNDVIKADIDRALIEAKATFEVLRPSTTTLRSYLHAELMICCTRSTLDANVAMMILVF